MRFIFIIMVFLFATSSAQAIFEDQNTEESSRQDIEAADLIISGQVIEIHDPPFVEESNDSLGSVPVGSYTYPRRGNPLFSKVIFQIENIYKGNIQTKRLTFYLNTLANCGNGIKKENQKEYLNNLDMILIYKVNGDFVAANDCTQIFDTHKQKILLHEYEFKDVCDKKCQKKKTKNPEPYSFKPREFYENKTQLIDQLKKDRPDSHLQETTFKGVDFLFQKKFDGFHLYINRNGQGYGLVYDVSWFDSDYDNHIIKIKDEYLVIFNKTKNKIVEKFTISEFLGQACEQDSNCIDGYYCRQDDYYKPYGMCSPCTELAVENRPASCQ